MDDNLDYSTGDYKRTPVNKGITFMTIGIFLAQIKIMEEEDHHKKSKMRIKINADKA